ncbi:uncharacterized protein LOC143022416 isoform X2 [Oratosquilla oratoria]|uniref:uncharacterized protein LOC143022416 isoform X2 n=1 Tax=Oratosquilla oratoria TaxID=337810 RepID=UPI003F75DA48
MVLLQEKSNADEAGANSAGADSTNSSVTDPVWSGQGKTLSRNRNRNGRRQHLRCKKKRTEQYSSNECLDGTEAEVYIDVAEHHEDSRKRKQSMDDDELVSVSDGIRYIKREDNVGVKIEISQEYLFDEPSGEQEVEKNRSDGKEYPTVNDGKMYKNSEYDYDNVKTENSQEYLFVESFGHQDNVKDKNEFEDVEQDIITKYGSDLQSTKVVERPSTSPGCSSFTPGHFPMEVPATEKKKNPTRKCVVCCLKCDQTGKPVRKESRYMCKHCNVALCIVPCFEKYHINNHS